MYLHIHLGMNSVYIIKLLYINSVCIYSIERELEGKKRMYTEYMWLYIYTDCTQRLDHNHLERW